MKNIIINIDQVRDARRIDAEEEIVQHNAIERIREILKSRVPNTIPRAPVENCFDLTERPHDVVAILGSRGSGKTTFLLSVLQDVDQPGKNKDKGQVLLPGIEGLVNLGLIDPTLIARKENLFLIIVSRIRDAVLMAKGLNRDGSRFRTWEDGLRRLARGLSALDEVGADPLKKGDWDDDQFAMEEGLAMVKSHRNLESHFQAFIETSLWLLERKAFIVGLDDIDTSFEKGWPVLETIRRYLTSNRLIVLLSGDSELFSALVRKQQWENLGDNLMKHDPRPDYYRTLVDRLEDQYLQKILKPENRIFLDSIYSYYKSPRVEGAGGEHDAHLMVRLSKKEEAVSLRAMIRTLLVNALFVTREDDLQLYERALLEQPMRSVTQLLFHFRDAFHKLRSIDGSAPGIRPLNEEQRKAVEEFQKALINIFTSSLLQMGWAPNLVRDMAPEDVGPMIAKHLVDLSILDPGYRLKPEFGNAGKNLAVLTVGAQVAGMMYRHPEAYLDYMLKVGLAHEVLVSAPADEKTRDGVIKEYVRFVGLDTMESALGVARRATAYLRGRDRGVDRRTALAGTVALYGDNGAKYPLFVMYGAKNNEFTKTWVNGNAPAPIHVYWSTIGSPERGGKGDLYNTLNSVERTIDDDMKGLINLPMQMVVRGDAEQTPVASIFNLLGVLRDIIGAHSQEDVRQILLRHAQLRSFPAPNRESPPADPAAGELETDDNETEENPNQLEQVSRSLWSWVEQNKRSVRSPMSVHLTAKVWARFYYTLLRTDAEVARKQNSGERFYCGELLHRFIIAFLNAILVEEMLIHGPMTLKNPSLSDKPFLSNLKRAQGDKLEASLFHLFWSCPLWTYFLDPDSEVRNLHTTVASRHEGFGPMVNTKFSSLYPLLNSLLIQRPLKLASPVQSDKANEDGSPDSTESGETPSRRRGKRPRNTYS